MRRESIFSGLIGLVALAGGGHDVKEYFTKIDSPTLDMLRVSGAYISHYRGNTPARALQPAIDAINCFSLEEKNHLEGISKLEKQLISYRDSLLGPTGNDSMKSRLMLGYVGNEVGLFLEEKSRDNNKLLGGVGGVVAGIFILGWAVHESTNYKGKQLHL